MSNPILNQENFERDSIQVNSLPMYQPMTVSGTLNVLLSLGLITVAAAALVWSRFSLGYTDMGVMLTGIGAIAGFILAIIISLSRLTSKGNILRILVSMYAICEGFFLGGISATFEASYPGIVSTAIAATFAALFSMLILYKMNLIRCTEKLRSVVFIGTLSIAGIYLINIIGHFFGHSVPIVYSASPIGIVFSVVVVLFAAFNLILDFDFIEQGAQRNFPKNYEWYGAFGLMVTLVWLYIEILRLLAKLQRR